MRFEEFRAGQYRQHRQYKSFSPSRINHEWTWDDPQINTLLETASKSLAELNAFSHMVPDVDLFIQMHVVKEATTSSRIEGTRTEMDEAVMPKESVDPDRRDDWQEVRNYVDAMNRSIEAFDELPLSLRLLRQAHRILMQGVRGKHRDPGQFRRSQNWIGGTSVADALFIPPSADEVPDLMADLEAFWHNERIHVPHLIRIAISHYQFETIHPFLDGNGRIGRLMIPLYFIWQGLLDKPSLYLSAFMERNKGLYYDALTTVRASDDLAHWVRFLLVSVDETARDGKETFQSILALREDAEGRIRDLGTKVPNAYRLLQYLYAQPWCDIASVAKHLGIARKTATNLIEQFVARKILSEVTGYRRNRVFWFPEYAVLFQA